MGIQQLTRLMPVLLAMLKVGTAINATTAGRMPINMAATHGTSMKWRKHMAMAAHLAQLVPDEDTHVDGEHAGAALGDGQEVYKLLLGYPLPAGNHLLFDKRYHGVASTDGEGANLEEYLKRVPIEICH